MRHLSAATLVLLTSSALATEPLSLTSIPTPPTALPPTSAENALSLTLFWDNDGGFAKPNGNTDKHYSAGAAVALQWQAPWVNSLLSKVPSFFNEFAPEHSRYAMGLVASLSIFTPEDISNPNPIYNDRPYAGWTYGGLIAQRSADAPGKLPVFEHLELDLGMTGPSSQAQAAQTWIHQSFDYTLPQGWDNQIKNDFGFDLKYERRYRISLLPDSIDLLPEAGFTLGTVHVNANAGSTLRAGFHLPSDFGPTRKSLPGDFTHPYAPSSELTWENLAQSLGGYFFLRASGVAVAYDTTLQGSPFQSSPVEVTPAPLYAELQYGIAIQLLRHVEFGYSQTWLSPQFQGQHNWDSYATLTLSFTYAW